MKHFFDDSIANAAGKIACATLPLITLGAIYNDTIEIIACIVGLIAAIVLAARITMMFGKTEPKFIANLDKTVSDLLALPYALFLCTLIILCFREIINTKDVITVTLETNDNDFIFLTLGYIVFVLLIISIFLYQRLKITKTNKKLAELQREQLKLEKDNLHLQIAHLEDEKNSLEMILRDKKIAEASMLSIIRERINLLNGLIAAQIADNDVYSKPYSEWIKNIETDRELFINSTRLAFSATHPEFIKYLENKGLTEYELNYACLYALGLRGKEVGEYIKVKRHYNISSDIRKKLGIDEHDTNLGIYIRRILAEM